MRITLIVIAALTLTACAEGGGLTRDGNRAVTGAVIGGGIAAIGDGNVLAGAGIGAAAGALCDDVGVCNN